jgi:hypothetical protein
LLCSEGTLTLSINVSLTWPTSRNGFNPGRRCRSLWREKCGGGFVLFQRLKGGFERPGLLASQVGLFDGWLGRLMSSGWVLLCGKPTRRGPAQGAFLPLKPYAVLLWQARAMLKEVDCLPMVKPNAASHSGIRHVYACAF